MSLQYDHPYILDGTVDRVQQEDSLYPGRIPVHSVENRGHIHEKQRKHVIEILRVPEKHEHRGQNHADSQVEHGQHDDRVKDPQHAGPEGDVIQRRKYKENDQRQPEIDDGGDVLAEQEHVFRYIDLSKDLRVRHQRLHAAVGRLLVIGKDQVPGKQISRIVLHVPSKKARKNKAHDQEREQRV